MLIGGGREGEYSCVDRGSGSTGVLIGEGGGGGGDARAQVC